MYHDKRQDLAVQQERDAKITNQKEKEFNNEVNEVCVFSDGGSIFLTF